MTAPGVFTQYSTIAPWLGQPPGWVPPADQQRIAAYQKYEEIYWSSEEGFEQVMRGDNENPIMMPTAKTIVNTVNRYTATGFSYSISGKEGTPEPTVEIAKMAFESLFVREQFLSQFASNKRRGIRIGDWVWHVFADDLKPLGRRITIRKVDPAAYFPVYESDIEPDGDPEKLIKVHLVEPIVIENQERISRLTYERLFDANGVQTGIQVSHGIFAPNEWSAINAKPERVVIAPKLLPEEIPAIPVYHLKNLDPTDPFGSSELRGLESVLLGINQTISDEDASLALDGIGIYATDGGAPRNEAGQEVDWVMGPGRVLTHAGGLKRVNGVGSVTPFGDHYNRMVEAVRTAVGASDVAVGKTDASTAESGIALLLELGPILAYTSEKDQHIIDVHSQMFHDLCFWLAVYEELPVLLTTQPDVEGSTPAVVVQPVVGEKIPSNLKAQVDLVLQLRNAMPSLISMQTAHKMLIAAGLPLEDNEFALIVKENAEILANFNGEEDDDADENRRQEENEDEDVPA